MRKNQFLFLFIAILLLCPLSVQAKGFSSIYVLGDSLSDQGNLFQATSELTNGAVGLPDAKHYYQGRFANGENYVDLLAKKLDLVVEPTISGGGSNFAYGGSRTDYNRVASDLGLPELPPGEYYYPWSLNLQREAFVGRNINDPEALYVLWAGANDVADITFYVLTHRLAVDDPMVQDMIDYVAEGLKQSVLAFIGEDDGARDILFAKIPDLGTVPLTKQYGPVAAQAATALAEKLNAAIDVAIVETLEKHPNVNIMVFDSFSVFRQIIATPSAYGFENVSDACYSGYVLPVENEDDVTECENPEDYLFWDGEHPTTAAHQVVASLMLQTIIDGMLTDFIDELKQFENLPGKVILIKNLAVIQELLADNKQKNDLIAIFNLKLLVKILERRGSSPFVDIDTSALSARVQQIVELAEANLP